jgi:type I restriction-modification system DNA methylase subunit
MNMSPSAGNEDTLSTCIDVIRDRLARGDGPSQDVIGQEAARAHIPAATIEAMLRLDRRFAKTPGGWTVQAEKDPWPDLVSALPQSMPEPEQADDLFRQVILEMSAATRSDFLKYYPDFAVSDALRKKIVSMVEACPTSAIPQLRGPIFDLVMSEVFDDPAHNRVFTPRVVPWFAAKWAQPCPGERALDMCHGSGGFLVAMAEEVSLTLTQPGPGTSGYPETSAAPDSLVYGLDRDGGAAWAGRTNLGLHGYGGSNLCHMDALDLANLPDGFADFDIVAGNPSFGDKITDLTILGQFELGRDEAGEPLSQQSSEVLFIEAFLRLAKPGARVIILVPDGILSNAIGQRVRDYLVQHALIEAIIGLPRRFFRNDAKANILLLRKKTSPGFIQEEPVFLATTDDPDEDLPEILRLITGGRKP